MFWNVIKKIRLAINITSVMLLAGIYVFSYYDYLHTVMTNNVTIGASPYRNGQLGTVTISEQVNYQ